MKRLQIRGHRGIVQGKKFTTVPGRCVNANCRNVVDIFAQHTCTFLWGLNNDFVKIQQAKWEPIQATVFQVYALMKTETSKYSLAETGNLFYIAVSVTLIFIQSLSSCLLTRGK